ncbi:MAG TPA: hypothetical protein VFW94_20055 [Candidatus Acidoferrales bacterium]|nr:hypothetical protein [Candidatus Acidoferrales bacterium]
MGAKCAYRARKCADGEALDRRRNPSQYREKQIPHLHSRTCGVTAFPPQHANSGVPGTLAFGMTRAGCRRRYKGLADDEVSYIANVIAPPSDVFFVSQSDGLFMPQSGNRIDS